MAELSCGALKTGAAFKGEFFLDRVKDHYHGPAHALSGGVQQSREGRLAWPHEIGEKDRFTSLRHPPGRGCAEFWRIIDACAKERRHPRELRLAHRWTFCLALKQRKALAATIEEHRQRQYQKGAAFGLGAGGVI